MDKPHGYEPCIKSSNLFEDTILGISQKVKTQNFGFCIYEFESHIPS